MTAPRQQRDLHLPHGRRPLLREGEPACQESCTPTPVHWAAWVAVPLGAGATLLLAFGDCAFWGDAPWELTKRFVFGYVPGVASLSLDGYQAAVRRCICLPMLGVHVLDGALACVLAHRAGSRSWPLWGARSLLLGCFQLGPLLDSPALKSLVLGWSWGLFVVAPFLR